MCMQILDDALVTFRPFQEYLIQPGPVDPKPQPDGGGQKRAAVSRSLTTSGCRVHLRGCRAHGLCVTRARALNAGCEVTSELNGMDGVNVNSSSFTLGPGSQVISQDNGAYGLRYYDGSKGELANAELLSTRNRHDGLYVNGGGLSNGGRSTMDIIGSRFNSTENGFPPPLSSGSSYSGLLIAGDSVLTVSDNSLVTSTNNALYGIRVNQTADVNCKGLPSTLDLSSNGPRGSSSVRRATGTTWGTANCTVIK